MVLLVAIRGRRADRCLGGGDRRAVCLSERHVEPHLVIGDVAAGQWADPFNEESTTDPAGPRSPEQPPPSVGSGQMSCRVRFRSGFALPPPATRQDAFSP